MPHSNLWSQIKLDQFKCYSSQVIPLAPLTLLTGLNAAGKSTVLQSINLLAQTAVEDHRSQELHLNGSAIQLGTMGDVVNNVTGSKSFELGIESRELSLTWKMRNEDRQQLVAPIESIEIKLPKDNRTLLWNPKELTSSPVDAGKFLSGPLQNLIPETLIRHSAQKPNFGKLSSEEIEVLCNAATAFAEKLSTLTYLSAERIGPRETYPIYSESSRSVGICGDRAPWVLYQFGGLVLHGPKIDPNANPLLSKQVDAWLSRFFPGAGYVVDRIPKANLVSLGLRSHSAGDFHRPQNVGFGISHLLPCLTACLAAEEGSIILMENPEAHLHPAGQSLMAEFLVRTAMSGVQLIVETHSDHIINGVRKAVKKGLLSHNDVAVHFLTQSDEASVTNPAVITPLLNASGAIDRWPPGFFDQFDKDLEDLVGWNE